MLYLAKQNNSIIYLSQDEQMDKYLEKGAEIYSEENGVQTLIATPENGFLVERPVFPVQTTSKQLTANEYEAAVKILFGLEE